MYTFGTAGLAIKYKKSLFPWGRYISGGSNNSRCPVKEKSPCRTGKTDLKNGDEM